MGPIRDRASDPGCGQLISYRKTGSITRTVAWSVASATLPRCASARSAVASAIRQVIWGLQSSFARPGNPQLLTA